MKKKNIGTPLDSWLREEGLYEEVTAAAIKRVLARQVAEGVKPTKYDWTHFDAMTDAEHHAAALKDPDAQPLRPEDMKHLKRVLRRDLRLLEPRARGAKKSNKINSPFCQK